MSKLIPILALFFLVTSCSWPWSTIVEKGFEIIRENYPDDNAYEEALEKWIFEKTGVEVDITGRSKEKDPYEKEAI